MKLSEIYTTGTVAKRNNDGSSVAYVCTKKLSELYPDLGMEFDTTILLNNGSTSELLNTGAFGQTATAYNKSNTLYNGEPSSKIQYLGCCVVREWGFGTFINLSKHLISGSSWDSNFKLRFVINVISSENIGYNDYQPFNIDESTNVVYDFNSTYVVCNFGYKKTNTTRDISGYVQNPHELDGTGDDGNTGKRICYDEYSVMATAYNKYLADTANISKTNVGELAFAYLINGDYFLVRKPLYVPDSGYNHVGVTIDSIKYYLTIGGFTDFDDGISGFLPTNDETKGAFAFRNTSSGQYVNCTNYFVTSNCAEYVLNSCGLRWVITQSISKAKDFRDNVRLGVMDKNGIINHKEWIVGESGIQASDNPNKDTSYDNIPDRPSPGGDDKDDDSDDINFGGSYAGLGAFAKFYLCSGLAVSDLNSWINGRSPDWPENFDPMTQIISVSRFATDISSASYGSTTIKFHTTAGAEIDTKIAALHGNGDNIELDLGSVNIPLRMKERGIPFLDYESTIELYIPACGTFILDPQTVLGSTLSVKMWLSTSTGECNSIAYVTRNGVKAPVAYGSGSLAVSMPITSIGWGSYLAAITNANIKYYFGGLSAASSELQLFGGVGTGNKFAEATGLPGVMSSFQNMGQAEQNLAHLKNSSFTSVSGSFGSTAAWNYPFNAYVKITRRHFKKPSNYAHTRGIPLVETKTLSDCSGFTICVNADVSSINATIQEKNMIVEALNNGVIV